MLRIQHKLSLTQIKLVYREISVKINASMLISYIEL